MKQVGPVPYAADYHARAVLLAERDGQPGPGDDFDVVPFCRKCPAQLNGALRLSSGWLFIGVDSHEHRDQREKMPRPIDDVKMTGGDGVESARVDRVVS